MLTTCSVIKTPQSVSVKPMEVDLLLEKPFGHNETMKEFQKNLPKKTKMLKLIKRSEVENQKPDTIFNFSFKKSNLSTYKTRFNQEFVVGGVVKNSEIELVNGIRTGMSKDEFFKSFINLENSSKDTITLKNKRIDRTFNFYFNKKGRLIKFNFTGSKQK
jgi:hypothetical protein